ncbi:MAG: hypothetical protein IKL08_02430 [Clostridia bacterium]|nr:hypothetical protein [Clostridia bacterium]
MKKRYYITAFIFGIFGIIYGTICNYFVRTEKMLFFCIMSGVFVGLLYFAMYYVLTLFLGNQYDEQEDKTMEKYMKMLIRVQNLVVFNALLFGSSLLIATGGRIALPLFWIHITNIGISIIIITVANFDGRRIRLARAREKKKATFVSGDMAEILSSEELMHLISTAPNTDIANHIIESVTGITDTREKYLLIKKLYKESLIKVSLNDEEEIYMDILQQVMSKNTIKENTQ